MEQMEKSQDKCQKAEEALQDEHKLSSALLDTVGALVVVLDREGRIIRFNRACEESTGYTFAEVKNKPFWGIFLTPGEKDGVKAVFHRLLSGDLPNTHENYWVTKKGNLRLISWSNTAVVKDGQVELIIGTGIDMTEREKVEKYITHLATFPQLSPSPILEIDLSGRITFYNAATLKTLERLGSPGHVEAFLPEDFEEIVQEANKTGESYHQREVRVGSSIFIETTSFLADLNVARIYASDITERKQAEGALRRIKASLAEAQRIAHLGNWEWDIARNELTWTDDIYRIFGLTPQEFRPTHDNFLSFIYPDDLMAVKNQVEEGINSGKYGPYDYRIVRRDGSIRLVYAQGETYFDQEGRPLRMVGTVQDITERKKAEEDRLQFIKLESLSILAGGVAHDFNNLLTTILLNIDLAMLNRKLDKKVIEGLVRAEEACFRAKELSGKLLIFAKGGKPLKTVMSLSKLVRESGQLALAGSKSRCQISIPNDLWPVEADEVQITQVIYNLLINADQAMPNGGIITIKAENVIVEEGSDLPLSEGKYVNLTITDQGIGIPSQYFDKIFDPYFTTKQKGSGLGLASAYSVIKNHSGHIKVESQLGVGTTFELFLPAIEAEILGAQEEQVTPIIGQGRILVMDDDENIREVLCRMLGQLGYEADSGSDGSQAIEKFVKAKESGRPFDAVILDLTVPAGMGGKETMERLLRVDPQVKAIVSSGYSDGPVMEKFKDYGFSESIAKPYRVAAISEILQRLIPKKGDSR